MLKGIIKIKCLRALRDKPVAEWICSRHTSGGKLVLKRNHAHYFQLQLLITEAKVSEPHVERIFSDTITQTEIIENTKKNWNRVLVPEYFLTRVPHKLLPVIF